MEGQIDEFYESFVSLVFEVVFEAQGLARRSRALPPSLEGLRSHQHKIRGKVEPKRLLFNEPNVSFGERTPEQLWEHYKTTKSAKGCRLRLATCGSESPRPPHGARRAGAGWLRPGRGRGAAGEGGPAPPRRFPTRLSPPSSRGARRSRASLPKAPEGRRDGSALTAPPPLKCSRALPGREGTRTPAGHGRGGGRRSLPGAAAAAAAAPAPAAPAAGPPCPPAHTGSAPLPSRGTRHPRGAGALHTTGGRPLGCCGVLRAGVSAAAPPLVPPPPLPGAPPRSSRRWVWSAAPPPDGRAERRREGGGSSDTHTRAAGPARPQPRPARPPPLPRLRRRAPGHRRLRIGHSRCRASQTRAPLDTASPASSRPPRRGAGGIPGAPWGQAASSASEASNRLCITSAKVREPLGLRRGYCVGTPSVCALTHTLKQGIPTEKKHTAIEFSDLCALSPVYTLKFPVGQEYGAFPLSCAALNRLVLQRTISVITGPTST
ncbi:proline-rich protein 2-like [Motacilla alba alba]|uniref:proline-rich protein 2-like n=1 Tax=Motacilla alba alba TaxID=1094192 RepID=UPI0018D57428|nr:proline-rich protein 2-like [Motacilla alba alba]